MAIKVKLYNQKAEEVGDLSLADKVFGVKLNETLVHQAMVTQMANMRQVLAHTKTRAEVRGGGRKPWRQKGTGRARAGSSRSPIWIGGGIIFGPTKDRNFHKNINKKMSQKAILMVLSDKAQNNNLIAMESLLIDEYKTKPINEILKNLAGRNNQEAPKTAEKKTGAAKTGTGTKRGKRSFLVINEKKEEKLKYSIRNLSGVKLINLDNINIVDLLTYRDLVLTKGAIKKLEEKYS